MDMRKRALKDSACRPQRAVLHVGVSAGLPGLVIIITRSLRLGTQHPISYDDALDRRCMARCMTRISIDGLITTITERNGVS